jgi:hypothetical protein
MTCAVPELTEAVSETEFPAATVPPETVELAPDVRIRSVDVAMVVVADALNAARRSKKTKKAEKLRLLEMDMLVTNGLLLLTTA